MRHPGLKTWMMWTAWVVLLMGTTAASYVLLPPPELPRLSLEASPAGFDEAGAVTVRFRLSRPAPKAVAVPYTLGRPIEAGPVEQARINQDFEIVGGPALVIPPGESEAKLQFRKKVPPPSPQTARRKRKLVDVTRTLTVALEAAPGYVPDDRHHRLELPMHFQEEILIDGPKPTLTLNGPALGGDEGFSDRVDKMTVNFELAPRVDYDVMVEVRLGGDAKPGSDYLVQDLPGDRQLAFRPGETLKSIILERAPERVVRGTGDRWIEVGYQSQDVNPGRTTRVRLKVPDPRAKLAWDLDRTAFSQREEGIGILRVRLSKPRSDDVTLRYRFEPADPGPGFVLPSPEPGGQRTVTLKAGKTSEERSIAVHKDDLVGGRPRTLQLVCAGVTPPDLADPELQPTLTMTTSDDKRLSGSALILVILTQSFARGGKDTLRELALLEQTWGQVLVDGSLYLLEDGRIYRWSARSGLPAGRKSYPESKAFEEVLADAYGAIPRQFGDRIVDKSCLKVLVWQDFTERQAIGAAAVDFARPPEPNYHLFWIGPPLTPDSDSGRPGLANLLRRRFPSVAGAARFHAMEDPGNRRLSSAIQSLHGSR
jgi:hypothetical protein